MRAQVIEAFLQLGENDLATMRRALLQRDAPPSTRPPTTACMEAPPCSAPMAGGERRELAALARQGNLEVCATRLPRAESDFRDAAGRIR
jgi:hypothetical protein